ncbi:hypothetical protein HJC23_013557 [Cyclotella cryptica]|uniref:Sulfotransferase domain-containing protein n=1 Tax=Cyclotella cryptica TaxID=29204 RepID=A0ABD3PCM7_9STRA|eukprot:CCRYP_015940-RA/>CCRYP_015940-RA protein AED:0.08 eAED:0.04 QI:0/0/0/1/0.5/0.66/3/0/374
MKYFTLSKQQHRSLVIVSLLSVLTVLQYLFTKSVHVHIQEEVHRTLFLQPLSSSAPCDSNYRLRCIYDSPEKSDTVLFWHVPKSGGTTAKRIYQCMGKTIADKLGSWPQFQHHKTKELKVFKPFPHSTYKTINVDTTNLSGMLRAKEMGLISSHTADIIFTHDISAAVRHLGFDTSNQGRALALFRDPIERLVSKFYYLRVASWERGYRPHWNNMTGLQWAESEKSGPESNYMVQKLSGKGWDDPVTENDLPKVKQMLRDHIIVGLLSDVEESFRRFNIVMGGLTGGKKKRDNRLASRCMKKVFHPEERSINEVVEENKNVHDSILPGSPEWRVLARKNHLDVHLYSYIETLFYEQKDIVDSYYNEPKLLTMPY